MATNVNTRIVSAILELLRRRGVDPGALLELSEHPVSYLEAPDRPVSNEFLIIMFAQARELLGDPQTAFAAGRIAGEALAKEGAEGLFSPRPEPQRVKRLISSSLRRLFPSLSVQAEIKSRESLELIISAREPGIHTRDHCLFIRGVISALIESTGGVVEQVRETECQVSIDRMGEIEGTLYRIDDQGRVWSRLPDQDETEEEERGSLDSEKRFLAHGTLFGSSRCLYLISWQDPRTLPAKVWSATAGKAVDFFRAVRLLEKEPGAETKHYREIAEQYQRTLRWEPSWQLTKAKYLSYFGLLCLALLPLAGHFYEEIGGEKLRALALSSLTLLILGLGFLIVKVQLDLSRQLLKQHHDSQKILEHAGVGVSIIRRDFTVEYANPLVVELHGEAAGRKCYEVFKWESQPCPECPLQEVLKGKPHAAREVEYLNRDGLSRWFFLDSTPVFDGNDNITAVINVSTDITERKRLEMELGKKQAELEASEAKYRSFMESAADAIVITDPEYDIIELNKTAAHLLGVSPREFQPEEEGSPRLNLVRSELLAAEDRERVEALFQEMLADRLPRSFETKLQRPDGRIVHIEARAIPILKNGKVEWIQAILRDVTERVERDTEKTLLLSISNAIKDAPNLNAMVRNALEGICKVMSVPVGAVFLKIPGQEKMKLATQVGMSPLAIQKLATVAVDGSAGDVASRTAILRRSIVINDMERIKATPFTKKRIKELGIQSMASIPMLMEDELQGVIYIASQDPGYFNKRRLAIIKQVANELAVGVAKQRLTDVLKEKNRELMEKNKELENATLQLLQSEKMASIGQLAAGVAHEINNPMGYINSNLNLLRQYGKDLKEIIAAYRELLSRVEQGRDGKELKALIQNCRELEESIELEDLLQDLDNMIEESIEGAERVTYIVQNLKEFSHPDTGNFRQADLHQCLENTLHIVWNELKYKAEVVKDFGEIPQVLCSPQEIKQVFLNLLVNASHAIPERGTITIRTRADEEWVYISIQDTGTGIPPENLSKIFDPFFTTKEVGKGTGLGLSISYNIVKKHGGRIEVQSEPGKGSTFTVVLPRKPEAREGETSTPEWRSADHEAESHRMQ